MIKEYLYNNTYKYTLTSGSEVTLTDEELEELIDENKWVEELEKKIEELESEVDSLNEDIAKNKTEIYSLSKEIEKLNSKV